MDASLYSALQSSPICRCKKDLGGEKKSKNWASMQIYLQFKKEESPKGILIEYCC